MRAQMIVRTAVVALLALAAPSRGATPAGGPLDEIKAALKQKYATNSIFLSFSALYDMRGVLNDPVKYPLVARQYPMMTSRGNQKVLDLFRSFLDRIRSKDGDLMSTAVAFVQIDFVTPSAGYMLLSAHDGTLQKLPWSDEEIVRIAAICDEFLTRFRVAQAYGETLVRRSATLSDAWTSIQKFKADPFIPDAAIVPMVEHFRSLIDEKPTELAGLMEKDRGLYEAISKFKVGHDSAIMRNNEQLLASVPGYRNYVFSPNSTLGLQDWTAAVRTRDQAIANNFLAETGMGTTAWIPTDSTTLADLLRPKTGLDLGPFANTSAYLGPTTGAAMPANPYYIQMPTAGSAYATPATNAVSPPSPPTYQIQGTAPAVPAVPNAPASPR